MVEKQDEERGFEVTELTADQLDDVAGGAADTNTNCDDCNPGCNPGCFGCNLPD